LSKFKDRKAISPVIATVILVAVAITIAVAVAYWMGGISSSYTKFEKVEIQSGYSTKVASGWNVTLLLKNSGSAASTVSQIFINSVPLPSDNYNLHEFQSGEVTTTLSLTDATIASGDSKTIYIGISNTYLTLSSGTTVDIKLHSAGGMDYVKLVELV